MFKTNGLHSYLFLHCECMVAERAEPSKPRLTFAVKNFGKTHWGKNLQDQKIVRRWQDSNLRGETPIDFESITLTARSHLPCVTLEFVSIYSHLGNGTATAFSSSVLLNH